ncbi:MAG: hypothetical protein ABI867_29420 [Kofleriaceae bacterium]
MTRSCLLTCLLVFAVACGDNRPGAGVGDDDDVTPSPQCSDGEDNDGDGTIDFPNDLGCESILDDSEDSPTLPKCSDGRDNDGDGKFDYPNDPGCLLPGSDDEIDDCPSGPNCPQCSNGRDDDLNGSMDFPNDSGGCEAAGDLIEFTANPIACGATMAIEMLPPDGIATGTLDGTSLSQLATKCGGGGGSSGRAYVIIVTSPKVLIASTDDPTTTLDTVIDLRSADCDDPSSHIACNDDLGASNDKSKLVATLDPGVYYIIVEGQNSSELGAFKLTVQLFAGEGAACTMQSECGPGLVCRTPHGQTAQICTQPVCNDGIDDDGDGKIDFPLDPGCGSPSDGTEEDDCPSGPNCPQCANGVDDDGDGQTDFPLDTTCAGAGGFIEGCGTEQDPILAITGATTTGTLVGSHDDHDPTCSSGNGPDVQFTLQLPAMQSLQLDTEGSPFDTIVSLRPPTCAATSIGCDDDGGTGTTSLLVVSNLAAGNFVVAVDAFSTTVNSFELHLSGTIAPGGSCETSLFDLGAITCPTGFTCDGTSGARTCRTECSDGIDNNGDGKTDFPNDPGCASPADNDEDTVCPGAMCPVCSDGLDNDGDGQTDFPLDVSCQSAGGSSESCTQTEPLTTITTTTITGTTVGQVNDFEPSCATTSGPSGPDVAYQIDLPAMTSVTFNLATSMDSVMTFHDSTCGPSEIVCRDPANLTAVNLAAGRFFLVVDGFFSTSAGTYTLTTTGVIAPGGSCESQLFTDGVIVCGAGFTCDGTAGARTCRTECSDGIDNNGDGKIDFPEDPGCATPGDNDENTVCPGVDCPACSDTIDNDGDGDIDFPDDPSCNSAGGTSEACSQSEPVLLITTPDTTGTTVGAVNDFEPTCAATSTDSGPDLVYQINLPTVATLDLDLDTDMDAVLVLTNGTCGPAELVCRDPETLSATNLAAGTYFIVVDGFFDDDADAFTLGVTGTIANGNSCESPLVAAGVLRCATGFACGGTPGSQTCQPPQCSDGIDNNGNGTTDFPDDIGCASALDALENDVVCPGATCPVCADSTDNDTDTLVDFPADFGCNSVGSATEVFCAADVDFGGVITSGTTTGDLAGKADNFDQTCQGNTGNDVTHALQLPQPVATLVLDTLTSTSTDTVLSIKDANCGVQLGCDDDGAPGTDLRSVITLTNVRAGNYAINVDSFSTTHNQAYTLHVKGTVAAGASCTSPLFAGGVLVCPTGQTCNGTVCQ